MGKTVLFVVLAFFVILGVSIGWWEFRVQTAEIKGRGDARIEIQSAKNRIPEYNHFFDVCASVQNAESSLDAQVERAETDPTNPTVQANIAALKAVRMQAIHQYNADAAKSYTSGQFLASNLPYRLDDAPYNGIHTVCTA